MNEEDELFESFLTGRLPAAERGTFESRLRSEPVLAREFARFRDAHDIVQLAGEANLRRKLMAIHGEERSERIPSYPIWSRLAIAASLLAAIASMWLMLGRNPTPTDLYADHMQAYPAPDRPRAESDSASASWARFGERYATLRYDDALAELDATAPRNAPAYVIAFYRGQCELLRSAPDPLAAIRSFEEVLATDNDMHAIAHWYIALASLKRNDVELARRHLVPLEQAARYKHEEASQLLRALP